MRPFRLVMADRGWAQVDDGKVIVIMPCCSALVVLRQAEVHPKV